MLLAAIFSALLHVGAQTVSNHFSELQSVGDLSSLIDSCDVNAVATTGRTQYMVNSVCDWLRI